jgi:alpha-tubulin suppressor-like RCC1 family protein
MATNFNINGVNFENNFIPRSLFTQGGLWMQGRNAYYGALGVGDTGNRVSPTQSIAGGINWKQLSCGMNLHAAGIKTDGTLWTWGYNALGNLGDNTSTPRSSPVQTIAGGNDWKQVSCGINYVLALKGDGTAWAWGRNGSGNLGTGLSSSTSSPTQIIGAGATWQLVAAGTFDHCAGVKTDGTLWVWGRNNSFGQLGQNAIGSPSNFVSSPIQTVSAGTTWKLTSVGNYYMGAIKTDGTLWMWGKNNYGQLGSNNTTNTSSPAQIYGAGTNWKSLSCGDTHCAAIKNDGTLWTWGGNASGQLGDNTGTDKSSPVQTIAGGTNWKQVEARVNLTGGIKTNGTLWLWGRNQYGSLGDGTIGGVNNKSSPVQIGTGNNWKQVSTGADISGAITDIF